jgi:tRNA(His) 5'-end guanylyltransferase
MALPFDAHFTAAMKATAEHCFPYFNFFIGFVGSDEITFGMRPLSALQVGKGGVLEFNGRIQKMVSLLAAKVSVTFVMELARLEGFEKTSLHSPHFDCRAFQVKSFREVAENIA